MDVILLSKTVKEFKDYPLHQHYCWELLFSLKGCGEIRIDNDILPFHEGSIFLIPPKHPHCKKSEDGYIDGCIFAENIDLNDNQFLVFEDDHKNTLFTLYDIAYSYSESITPSSKLIIESICDTIFRILMDDRAKNSVHNFDVDKFVHRLMDNVSNVYFDFSAALRETGYNVNYFSYLFKESIGVSPHEYFIQLRIEQAKRSLKQYGNIRSIWQVAEMSGFSDPAYFSRKFKQYTGMTPSEYIKMQVSFDRDIIERRVIGGSDDPERILLETTLVSEINQKKINSDKDKKIRAVEE